MILVTATGKKGYAPRALSQAVDELLAKTNGDLEADQEELIRCCQAAANKLIARAPRGFEVSVQLAVSDAPFGGGSGSVVVDFSRPRSR